MLELELALYELSLAASICCASEVGSVELLPTDSSDYYLSFVVEKDLEPESILGKARVLLSLDVLVFS